MEKIVKTHFEKTTHKGGPLRATTEKDMPKKSGIALCGVLLDDQNQPRIFLENVNCKECLNKFDAFK